MYQIKEKIAQYKKDNWIEDGDWRDLFHTMYVDFTPAPLFRLINKITFNISMVQSRVENKIKYGAAFPVSDTWSLDTAVARFMLPRLRAFVQRADDIYFTTISFDPKMVEIVDIPKSWYEPKLIDGVYLATKTGNKRLLGKVIKALEFSITDPEMDILWNSNKLTKKEMGKIEKSYKEMKEGYIIMGFIFTSLWD